MSYPQVVFVNMNAEAPWLWCAQATLQFENPRRPMSEQPMLQIQENENAIVAKIQCSEFDHDTTARLRAEMDSVIAPTSTLPVVLDLSNVTFMPSMTLGALIEVANKCKSQKRRLVMIGITPSVQDVFNISGLSNFFEARDSVEDVL